MLFAHANIVPNINYSFHKSEPMKVGMTFRAKNQRNTELLWVFVSYHVNVTVEKAINLIRKNLRFTSNSTMIAKKYFFWDDYKIMRFGSVVEGLIKIQHKPYADIALTYDVPRINYINLENGSKYIPSLLFPVIVNTPEDIVEINFNFSEVLNESNSVFVFTKDGKVLHSKKGDAITSIQVPAATAVSTSFLIADKRYLKYEELEIGYNKFKIFSIGFEEKDSLYLVELSKRILYAQLHSFDEMNKRDPYNIIFIKDINQNISYYNDINRTITLFIDPRNHKDTKYLIGHEFLHRIFIREKLLPEQGSSPYDPDFYWFIEGFNNYLTKVTNLKYGIISREEYLNDVNDNIDKYLRQKVTNKCNNSGIDTSILHGELLAMELDNMLKLSTNNKYTLLALIKDLVEQKSGGSFSLEDLDQIVLKRYGNKISISDLIKLRLGSCINYTNIQLPKLILDGKVRLVYLPSIGFSHDDKMYVKDIDIYGNAYKSGLGIGDKILSFDVFGQENNRVSLLKIASATDGKVKKLSYTFSKDEMIPRYYKAN